jgi:hypothetical protein
VPLQEQQAVVPLQEQWVVALQAQIWVVALQAGAEDSQNASPRISPSAGPRNSYTVALTSLLPFARERRFRSVAVIARSPIHGRPPLLDFVTPSIGFVTIEGFVTGFVTSPTPKSHPPQCLSPHNRQRGASIQGSSCREGAPTSPHLGPHFYDGRGEGQKPDFPSFFPQLERRNCRKNGYFFDSQHQ